MKKLHFTQREKAHFDKALTKITDINKTAIANKLDTIKSNEELDLLLTANDKDFSPLFIQYCNKSGRELRRLNLIDLKRLIAINGREEAINLLTENACCQYAPEWLHTEPKTLNKLMVYDVNGYFIYAASHIFHSDVIKKTNLRHAPPVPILDTDSQVNDFLFDFPQQDKPTEFIEVEIPKGTNERYFNLQDKFISRRNLDLYGNKLLTTEANELLRKFLGLCKPENAAKITSFSFNNLHEITHDDNNMRRFIAELKTAIIDLFKYYYRQKQNKRHELYAQRLRDARITSSDIASLKALLGGLSNFHSQPKIKNLSAKESVLFDLRGFLGWDAEQDKTLAKFRGTNVDRDEFKETPENVHTVKKGFKLKIGKKS